MKGTSAPKILMMVVLLVLAIAIFLGLFRGKNVVAGPPQLTSTPGLCKTNSECVAREDAFGKICMNVNDFMYLCGCFENEDCFRGICNRETNRCE